MFFQNNFAIFVKSVTKISGKVAKKIWRIYSLNFSVENRISECRVSLKKCLCARLAQKPTIPAGSPGDGKPECGFPFLFFRVTSGVKHRKKEGLYNRYTLYNPSDYSGHLSDHGPDTKPPERSR